MSPERWAGVQGVFVSLLNVVSVGVNACLAWMARDEPFLAVALVLVLFGNAALAAYSGYRAYRLLRWEKW